MIDYQDYVPFLKLQKNIKYEFEVLSDGIRTERISEKTNKPYIDYIYKVKLLNEEMSVGKISMFVTDHIKMIQLANTEFEKKLDTLILMKFSYINHFKDGEYSKEIRLITINSNKLNKVVSEEVIE